MEYKTIRVNDIKEVSNDGAYHVIRHDREQEWYLNGLLHRENGTAAIYAYRFQGWYRNGKVHQEDDSAIIYANETKYWYLNNCEGSQKAVETPKDLAIKDIINWKNVEGQRVIINIYGLERFIFDSNPKIKDIDSHSINGHRVLLKVKGI